MSHCQSPSDFRDGFIYRGWGGGGGGGEGGGGMILIMNVRMSVIVDTCFKLSSEGLLGHFSSR